MMLASFGRRVGRRRLSRQVEQAVVGIGHEAVIRQPVQLGHADIISVLAGISYIDPNKGLSFSPHRHWR
jgi:hypothetical protein